MNKVLKVLGVVFFSIGIIIMGLGVWAKVSFNEFLKTAKETTAIITDIDFQGSSKVIVEFTVDGKKYNGRLDYYSSSMYIGKKESIYYDTRNPNRFKSKESSLLFLIPFLIGGIFSAIGLIFLIVIIKKSRNRKKVLSYNYIIHATIIGINLDTTLSVNGRNPYRLEATYISPLDGKIYIYKSDELWSDITPVLSQRQITTIPVYINPNNYSEYYVDMSSVKEFIGN